jgi:hypothetical protein
MYLDRHDGLLRPKAGTRTTTNHDVEKRDRLSTMIKPTTLRASRSIVDDLALAFDFNPDRASRDHSWIKLIPEQRFDVLAGDSSGEFFLCTAPEIGNNCPSCM